MFTPLSNRYGFILRFFGHNFVFSCGPRRGINPQMARPLRKVVKHMKDDNQFYKKYYPSIADKIDYKMPPTKVIGCKDA